MATPHEEAPASGLPLADVRVIGVEQFGAGPWATLQLADLGAEVIKIENPASGGDVSRYVPPYQAGEDSLYFETFNRNKKSISLDLANAAGRQVFEDLVRQSDALVSNLRGDQPRALHITYADLAHLNRRIVCCSLSGFGASGPRAHQGGYDYIVQGLAGWMSLTGEPDGPPAKSGLSIADYSAGYAAALALLAGLWRARRDGVGCDCDISLFETALAQLTYVGTWVASAGLTPVRLPHSAHPSIVPFQNFRTADGWMVVACPKQKFWERLCVALGRPELAHDERFADFTRRLHNREAVAEVVGAILATAPTEHWLRTLGEAGVPSAPINTVAEALDDPQAEARGSVIEIDHPTLGRVREVATPLRVGLEDKPRRRAPFRGEHLDEVLREVCNYTSEQVADLAARGAFGPHDEGRAGSAAQARGPAPESG